MTRLCMGLFSYSICITLNFQLVKLVNSSYLRFNFKHNVRLRSIENKRIGTYGLNIKMICGQDLNRIPLKQGVVHLLGLGLFRFLRDLYIIIAFYTFLAFFSVSSSSSESDTIACLRFFFPPGTLKKLKQKLLQGKIFTVII